MPAWSNREPSLKDQALTASGYFFSLRRWTRVLRSNLRCFFLDIRLRRFLITEPILGLLAGCGYSRKRPAASAAGVGGCPDYSGWHRQHAPGQVLGLVLRAGEQVLGLMLRPCEQVSASIEVGVLQVSVHRHLRNPEGTPDAHRGQLTGVYQPVNRHLGYAHHRGHLGDREELHLAWHGLLVRRHASSRPHHVTPCWASPPTVRDTHVLMRVAGQVVLVRLPSVLADISSGERGRVRPTVPALPRWPTATQPARRGAPIPGSP